MNGIFQLRGTDLAIVIFELFVLCSLFGAGWHFGAAVGGWLGKRLFGGRS